MALNFKKVHAIILLSLVIASHCGKDWSDDQNPKKWNDYSRQRIDKMLTRKLNGNVAKNIILFLGDGMGITTVTAGRILKGQLQGDNGEEHVSAMESLDHCAFSKTYNINAQTADSAGTATAFMTGVKSRIRSIGVDGRAVDCATTQTSKLDTILKWAHRAGKSVGLISTARVTHATPAASYANVYERDMEAFDGENFKQSHYDEGCRDIAAQLIDENAYIDLVFAGGRAKFMRETDLDPKDGKKGDRIDNRNLIDEWEKKMAAEGISHKYIWNRTDFNSLRPSQYQRILGLLNRNHMQFELERQKSEDEPSLSEMTKKAIEILRTNPNGYFLLVEGGKIDHGHHDGSAKNALYDFVAFDTAIQAAKDITDEQETLMIATADHSHVFTMGGYSNRGNPMFGINRDQNGEPKLDKKNQTYTSLNYANGPGGLKKIRNRNLTDEETSADNYNQEAAVNLKSETHGGEDVPIYASGPMSYLFDGTVEESFIAHVMAYSACIGPYDEKVYINCKDQRGIHSVKSNGVSTYSQRALSNMIYSLILSIAISASVH